MALSLQITLQEGRMKIALHSMLLLATSFGLGQSDRRTFSGSIMDSQCAAMGGHASMEKQVEAKGAEDCTKKCVKIGGKYVLYNPATKTAYELDDQEKAANYAGQKVKVTGTYKESEKILKVEKIEAGS